MPDSVIVSGRMSLKVKDRLERYCSGDVDGEKHIQENTIELAVSKFLDQQDKLTKAIKS